ncbi:MAG: DUF1674 domain-containing protein [Alphaproteobacteria bacterium]|nr:DUF1674 domain-containing protein [Alphaproteobacteria bacterium]
MTDANSKELPLLKRPVKAGQAEPVGLTPIVGRQKESLPLPDVGGRESGGPQGAEPTRFGDWERKGRCSDF